MGMRCDQFMGLNEWALNFVKGDLVFIYREEVTRIHPDGHRETLAPRPVYESSVKSEESDSFYVGMFGDEYITHKYTFPDGRVYHENVQAAPRSSGPVFFLALKDENGNWVRESLWTQEEINNA